MKIKITKEMIKRKTKEFLKKGGKIKRLKPEKREDRESVYTKFLTGGFSFMTNREEAQNQDILIGRDGWRTAERKKNGGS